jgi:transcriptional regulator with XRE-family HTH domain
MAEKPEDSRYPTELRTLGDRLRARRLDLGLRQKDVARLLGVTEDSVCYWESGRVRPSSRMIRRIQDFLVPTGVDDELWILRTTHCP